MAENGPLATTVEDAALHAVRARRPTRSWPTSTDPRAAAHRGVDEGARCRRRRVDEHWAAAARETGGPAARRRAHRRPRRPALRAATLAVGARALDGRHRTRRARSCATAASSSPAPAGTRRSGGPRCGSGCRARRAARGGSARAETFFADYDVLLTPTLAQPPIAARGVGRARLARQHAGPTRGTRRSPRRGTWPAGRPSRCRPASHPNGTAAVRAARRHARAARRCCSPSPRQLEQLRPWPRTAPVA